MIGWIYADAMKGRDMRPYPDANETERDKELKEQGFTKLGETTNGFTVYTKPVDNSETPLKTLPKNALQLDGKFHVEAFGMDGQDGMFLVKTSNGERLNPAEEPVIVFRARDKFALRILLQYESMCQHDGCTDYHLKKIGEVIARFATYANEHNDKMKQPGCTMGK